MATTAALPTNVGRHPEPDDISTEDIERRFETTMRQIRRHGLAHVQRQQRYVEPFKLGRGGFPKVSLAILEVLTEQPGTITDVAKALNRERTQVYALVRWLRRQRKLDILRWQTTSMGGRAAVYAVPKCP